MAAIDLRPWPGAIAVRVLSGGHRNEVIEVRRGPARLVARRSLRPPASLDWELDLLGFLADRGFAVPVPVPSADGSRSVDGTTLHTWLDGRPPRTSEDWQAVARELGRLHDLTAEWPQRPGFSSVSDLLGADRSGDVDMDALPRDVATECRAAWRRLAPAEPVVVHGDPCAANIRIGAGTVGLLDWDEARVDHPDLDLAELPGSPLRGVRARHALAAVGAWEVAAGWVREPAYARGRLADLRARPAAECPERP